MTGMIRFNPNADIIRTRMNRLFDQAFGDYPGFDREGEEVSSRTWLPAVDIRETDDSLVLTAELPGLSKEDVDITLERNILAIRGERRFEKEDKEENYHRIERSYGTFARSFTLPSNVTPEGVTANFENGVLRIVVPKAEEAKPRKVDIG